MRVAVTRTEAGDALQVEVPEAAPGTKLRFNGLELPLVAGRATFPLAPDALHVGTNTVAVAVIAPGGDAATREIALDVDFRVRADLAELIGPQRAIDLLLSGRSISGADAAAMGMAQVAADPEAAALSYFTEHLKPKSASSLRFAVQAARCDYAARVRAKIERVERMYLDELMKSHDAVEGLEAFVGKRAAQWQHR